MDGISTFVRGRLRKKKYKKVKYKNSKNRKHKKRSAKTRKEKAFKKERSFNKAEINRNVTPKISKCVFCLISSENANIFTHPIERHCCDFCDKYFSGTKLSCDVCQDCLYSHFRKNFCDVCTSNLGCWNKDWRLGFNIPMEQHPLRCGCENCTKSPCSNCEMESHSYKSCPWRDQMAWPPPVYIEEGNSQDDDYNDYYDDDEDRIQEAVRDDYIFGWDH